MIKVAILGATGTVGQKFITLLQNHPQFTICELVASQRSAGKLYKDACNNWKQNITIPTDIAHIKVKSLQDTLESHLLFSGLDSLVAYDAEKHYAQNGHMVISNAKNHRMEDFVPLVVPEINHTHIKAVKQQSYYKCGGGIITNPNCATLAFVMALAPLHKTFGVDALIVHSMQAVSGAGYPGVSSMDILGNIIPYIAGGEEEKIEKESKKILGDYNTQDGFVNTDISISAHTNRVPVIDGHMICMSLSFKNPPKDVQEIKNVLKNFFGFPQQQLLYSAPLHPVIVCQQEDRPQPALDVWAGKGMVCSVGRIRKCNVLDYKCVSLAHNTVRGAAGCAIINAETALAMGVLQGNTTGSTA